MMSTTGLRGLLQRALLCVGVFAVAGAAPRTAHADGHYPSQPMRILVPFDPGAAVDVVARMLATGLSSQSGKPVVVENRAGGLTFIAAQIVAHSEPDGYTLFFALDDTFTTVPHLSNDASFDPNKELVPVTLVGKILMLMLENPAVPADSLPALIDYAHAHPTGLSYGSSGAGSATQLAMEMLKSAAKINFLHVPYKGIAPALAAAVSGEVQLTMSGYGTAKGLVAAGKLRPIAIAGPERVDALPNIPSTGDLGYPKVDATSWLSLAAPAKTPPAVVEQINQAVSRVLHDPAIKKQIEARDIVITDMGPKDFAQRIAQRYRVNGEAIEIAGVRRD